MFARFDFCFRLIDLLCTVCLVWWATGWLAPPVRAQTPFHATSIHEAAHPAPGSSPSLPVLIQRVLAVHPLIERGGAEREATQQLLNSARWARFPSLQVGAATTEAIGSSTSWRLQQPIYTFGRIQAALDIAQANLEASHTSLDATRRALIERSALAFSRLHAALEQVSLARDNLSRHEALNAFITRRAEGGLAARSDILLAEGRTAFARSRVSAFEGQADQARAEIESLARQRWSGSPGWTDVPVLADESAEVLGQRFVRASVALQRLASQIDAAKAEATLSHSERYPVVLARLERATHTLTAQPDSRAVLTIDYQSGPGLSALSDHKAKLSRVDALRAEARSQRDEIELFAASLVSQRRALVGQRESILSQVRTADDTVSAFMRQFDASRRSWLDVLNAERERFDARLLLAQVEAALRDTELRVLTSSGAFDKWDGQR